MRQPTLQLDRRVEPWSYFLGLLTSGIVAAVFMWHTPNIGWSEIDEDSVKIKRVYENRELVTLYVAAPVGVEVEHRELP